MFIFTFILFMILFNILSIGLFSNWDKGEAGEGGWKNNVQGNLTGIYDWKEALNYTITKLTQGNSSLFGSIKICMVANNKNSTILYQHFSTYQTFLNLFIQCKLASKLIMPILSIFVFTATIIRNTSKPGR